MKKIWIGIIVIALIIISSAAYLFFDSRKAVAAGAGDVDGIDLHIICIASSDNGATWHNFSGTDLAQGETLSVSPGATIQFVIFVFGDDASAEAFDVQIQGTVTNAAYVDALQVSFPDFDGDLNAFNGFTFQGGGIGTVAQVLPGVPNEQVLMGGIQLSNNFPVGQTTLLGRVEIFDYALVDGDLGFHPLTKIAQALGIKSAKAMGVGKFSAVQIAVNQTGGGAIGRPKVTPSSSPTASEIASQVTTLPKTGGSIICDLKQYFRF